MRFYEFKRSFTNTQERVNIQMQMQQREEEKLVPNRECVFAHNRLDAKPEPENFL